MSATSAAAVAAGQTHNLCKAKGHARSKELLKPAVRKNNYRRIRSVAAVAAQEQWANEKRAQQVQRGRRVAETLAKRASVKADCYLRLEWRYCIE